MRVLNPLVGADIELFLLHRAQNEIVSAEGYVPGTKHEPFNFDPSNKHFAVSLDNVAAEFCIPPVSDKEAWIAYLNKSIGYLNASLPEELCTVAQPAAILADKYLQTDNAKLFGCDPDYCVWTKSMNERPNAENSNLRSAGGHIHIGYDDPNMDVNEALVKAMDLCVGVPSVIQEPDNERKLLYGKAGCFRWKDYGVEYRTVSNYYLQSQALMEWAFDATMRAIDMVSNDEDIDYMGSEIRYAIDANDKDLAHRLVRQFNLQLV